MVRKRDTKQIDYIARKIGLSREQRRLLHAEITGRNLTHKEIVDKAREVKQLYPGK